VTAKTREDTQVTENEGSVLGRGISRRSFLQTTGLAAGATALTFGTTPVLKTLAVTTATGAEQAPKTTRTVCSPNCINTCGINVTVRDGCVVKLEQGGFPDERYRRLCLKGISNIQRVYSERRVRYPMKRAGERGSGKFERISWDEATTIIAKNFKEVADKYGPEALAWQAMTGDYGILTDSPKRLISLLGGTVPSLQGLMADLNAVIGTMVPTGTMVPGSDHTTMVNSKMVILWPYNVAESGLNDMHFIYDAKEAGAKIVCIDPKFTPTAAAADWWIPIRPGGDSALAMGMINVMFEDDSWDGDFMAKHSIGPVLVRDDTGALLREKDVVAGGSDKRYAVWDETASAVGYLDDASVKSALLGSFTVNGIPVKPALQVLKDEALKYTPAKVEEITGVPAADVVKLAKEYAAAKPAMIRTSEGMNRTLRGYQPFRGILTLCAMHGDIGIIGGGHSESGGWGAMLPLIMSADITLNTPDPTRLAKNLKGMQLFQAITQSDPRPIKALWITKCNILVQGPARKMVTEDVLPRLDFLLVSEITMTETAKWADVILPVPSHFEQVDLVGGYTNWYVQLRQKVIEPLWECKSDLQATGAIAEKMGLGEYFTQSEEEYIADILTNSPFPFFHGITLDDLKKGAVRAAVPDPWIAFADLKFPTATGTLEFYTEAMKPIGHELPVWLPPAEGQDSPKAKQYPLSVIGKHGRFSAHSTHHQIPWIKELDPEPRLEINPVDAESRGIKSGDFVTASNDRGHCTLKAKLTKGIMPGVVSITSGWWSDQFKSGSYSDLTAYRIDPIADAILETNFAPYDVLVEVRKEG